MVLPWYDPVRFAEDVAMLASLTTGPLYIGMGRGTAKLGRALGRLRVENSLGNA